MSPVKIEAYAFQDRRDNRRNREKGDWRKKERNGKRELIYKKGDIRYGERKAEKNRKKIKETENKNI